MAIQEPVFEQLQQAYDEGSYATLTRYHRKVHEGRAYKICFTSSAATNSTTIYLQINGSSNVEGHLKGFTGYVSEGFLDVKFIECSTSSTHTTGSASITAYNRNRPSANVTSLEFFSNPTDVSSTASDNVAIDRFQVGGTGGSNQSVAVSSNSIQEDEWEIGNSTYIMQIALATTAASCFVSGCLLFYEES